MHRTGTALLNALEGARSQRESGPCVARLFHRLLAAIFLVAWISWGIQVHLLIGRHGLAPVQDVVDAANALGTPWWAMPSFLRWGASDAALSRAVAVGVLLSSLALIGVVPRICMAINAGLYLGFTSVSAPFTSFQWDSLLIESAVLAVFLPRHARLRWIHVVFRLLLFKLYWESGIAKWQSQWHDWANGSAMTHYYETAPIPAGLAWHAHHLPAWWHHIESRAVLGLELVVPFGFFVGRRVRLGCAAVLTAFQIVNVLTANYGFFVYLALALHVFLLDDATVQRAYRAVASRFSRRWRIPRAPRWVRTFRVAWVRFTRRFSVRVASVGVGVLFASLWVTASVYEGMLQFVHAPSIETRLDRWIHVYEHYERFRLANTYHLFGSITRTRDELEFQAFNGLRWVSLEVDHKPGDPLLALEFVAPHQPRLAFQLWFFGEPRQAPLPHYVASLLDRICNDPDEVQSAFRQPIPAHPRGVRIVFYRYRFTTPVERQTTGAYWHRDLIGATRPARCD